MRYKITAIVGILAALGLAFSMANDVEFVAAAPSTEVIYQKNLIPLTDSRYTLGTTSQAWLNGFFDEICLAGDCKTAWPVGGGGSGGGFPTYFQNGGATLNTATTTVNFTPNSFSIVESPADTLTIRVATTTLGLLASSISDFVSTVRTSISETITGLTYTSGTGVLSIDAGYSIPLTASTTEGSTAFTWGNHASQGYITDGNTNWDNSYGFITDGNTGWDNTYGLITATNATASITYATTTNLYVPTSINLFGGGTKTTANDLCIQLTGSSALCDGTDATGGAGGSDVNWSWSSPNTFISPATTTNGIIVRASSTIGDGSAGLTINGNATTTGLLNVGGYGNNLGAGISSPSGFLTASTSGRSGLILQNYGTGTAPEYRFIVGDPYTANDATGQYIAFGLTNSGATAGGALFGLQKKDITYLVTQSRDMLISSASAGKSLFLAAGALNPSIKIDGTTGRIGINIATTTTPTSTLSVNGDIYYANSIATGTATATNLVASTGVNLFGGGYKTTANDLCIQLTGSSALCDGTDATGGGGGGSISTSSIPVAGNLSYWTSASTLSDVATGTLSESVTGLELDATRGLVGGSAILSLTSGYSIPLTASTTNWNTFYDTPSNRITDGNGLTWSGNTLNFDGGNTPAGDLGGTWASPSVTDDSHAHTGTTLSGIDISDDTNLSADGTEIVLTGDALSLGNALTFTSGTATNFEATNIALFGGGQKTTANALCIQLTGSADLCDGGDASGGGGGVSDWVKTAALDAIRPTTTVGIVVSASSTIGDGTATGGLTVNGGATTTGAAYFASTVGIGTTSPSTIFSIQNTNPRIRLATGDAGEYGDLYVNSTGVFNLQSAPSKRIDIYGDNITLGDLSTSNTFLDLTESLVSVNPGQTNQDFGITSDTIDNLFYVDASANSIGIASTTPSRRLTIAGGDLWVGGNIIATGTATSTGIGINTEYFSDLTGFGMSNSAGALGLNTTGAADGECLVYVASGPTIDWTSCGGVGGSKWTDSGVFTYLTATTDDVAFGASSTTSAPFWWDVSATTSYIGNGGAGDSVITFGTTGTEWTMGFDDTDDSFVIASSTALGSFDFLALQSTTTTLYSSSTLHALIPDKGVRFGVGSRTYYGNALLDQLVLNGRQRNESWIQTGCDFPYQPTSISTEIALTPCPEWQFMEDTTSTLTGNLATGYQYVTLNSGAANDGGMISLQTSAALNSMRLATSTPSFEVTARIGTIAAGASTTKYYIGFTNIANNSSTFETEPTAGCYFMASSTSAGVSWPNWYAICSTSATARTVVDTGVASTSVTAGAGNWKVFRIDADGNRASFYIKNGSAGNLTKVAEITSNVPGTVALNPQIFFGRTTGTQTIAFDVLNWNLWIRKMVPDS